MEYICQLYCGRRKWEVGKWGYLGGGGGGMCFVAEKKGGKQQRRKRGTNRRPTLTRSSIAHRNEPSVASLSEALT
jgi:hypothetical protein